MKNNILKGIAIILLVTCIWMPTNAQRATPKTINTKEFKTENKKLDLHRRVFTEYDRNGKLIKEEHFVKGANGALIRQKNYWTRTSNKNEIFQMTEYYDSLGNKRSKEILVTTQAGRKVRLTNSVFSKTGDFESINTVYLYDQKTNSYLGYEAKDAANKLVAKELKKLNNMGEEVSYEKWALSPINNKLLRIEFKTFEYDDLGGITKIEWLKTTFDNQKEKNLKEITNFEKNMMTEQFKYTDDVLTSHYSKKNPMMPSANLTDMASIMPKKKSNNTQGNFATDIEYDEDGNKIKTTYFEGDVIVQVNTFEYDTKGHLTKTNKKYLDKKGNEISNEISETNYDNYGNIVRTATSKNGEIDQEQIIEYVYH